MDGQDIILPYHANPIVLEWIKDGKAKISESGCWEWTRGRNSHGYGMLFYQGSMKGVHRLAVKAEKGFVAMHSCDNPQCCNPWHISIGTQHENKLDMKEKKRGRRIGKLERCACGKAATKKCRDCHDCRSIRLGKPPCHCGAIAQTKGLCQLHYRKNQSSISRHASHLDTPAASVPSSNSAV
jgi:hypothetical protein